MEKIEKTRNEKVLETVMENLSIRNTQLEIDKANLMTRITELEDELQSKKGNS